ncbi:MAG: polysaccharide export protein [Nitrospiraceae bacterium]|nr:MAG: polysaccharide export protein [Nitrospiraceae bacterium]
MKKKTRVSAFISIIILVLLALPWVPASAQIQVVPVAPSMSQAEGKAPSEIHPLLQQPQLTEKLQNMQQPEQQMGSAQPALRTRPSSEAISKFEQFIAGESVSSVSTNIRQFGYDLFKEPSSFVPSANVPVGPSYVVGPGDEIRITVWGKIEGAWHVTVDRDGNVSLPKIGVVGITGLTFEQLKELLHKEFSKYYTGFEMNVSMGALRTMRVYVVGNAQNPGAYTVSSLSTLVNALLQAGGPSKTGTMRDIQLKRNGILVEHFDMYDLLLKGDKSRDARLLPEDVIFIPSVGPLAGIAGNVRNPAIYELREETRLLDLIQMAGGLTSVAFKGRVQVERIADHQFRKLFEGDFYNIDNDPEKNFLLQDGDLIKVFAVIDTKNTVTLAGAVANAGDYGIISGKTRISDVISLAGGLMYYASDKAELTRVKVTPSGPLTEQIAIDIFKAAEGDPQHNIPLEINDYILVRNVPGWKLYQTVSILGEVKFPGTYTIEKGERLSSVLERAGGYTDDAYLRGAIFTRARVRDAQQHALAEMTTRLERELLVVGSQQVSTALSPEEIEARKVELEQRKKFVESLKQLKSTGRMSIRLAHLRLLKNNEYDIELEDGDNLFIPMKNNVVNVVGSVMSSGSFIYSEKAGYKDYINLAGGYSRYADENNVYVMKSDGTARKLSNGFLNWNVVSSRWEVSSLTGDEAKEIEPGDTITVPEKLDRIAWLREIKDITQIMYQIAVTAGVAVKLF